MTQVVGGKRTEAAGRAALRPPLSLELRSSIGHGPGNGLMSAVLPGAELPAGLVARIQIRRPLESRCCRLRHDRGAGSRLVGEAAVRLPLRRWLGRLRLVLVGREVGNAIAQTVRLTQTLPRSDLRPSRRTPPSASISSFRHLLLRLEVTSLRSTSRPRASPRLTVVTTHLSLFAFTGRQELCRKTPVVGSTVAAIFGTLSLSTDYAQGWGGESAAGRLPAACRC